MKTLRRAAPRARLRRLPQPKETQIQSAILRALHFRRDCFVWRNNSGAFEKPNGRPIFFGLPGSADIVGLVRTGRFLALEVKRPGCSPTALQLAFADSVTGMSGYYAVVTSVDEALEAVDEAIGGRTAGAR